MAAKPLPGYSCRVHSSWQSIRDPRFNPLALIQGSQIGPSGASDVVRSAAEVNTCPMSEPSSHRHPLSKHAEMMAARRFFLLFVFLLATLILYPYTEDNGFRYYLLRFLGAAVVLLSVYAVSFRRSLLIVALVLAIPAFLQHTLLHEFNSSALSILRSFFSLVYDVFIIVVIFRRVFSHERPNAETLFGALCIYLLIGFGFAGLYGV